jgi:hypothetical protein
MANNLQIVLTGNYSLLYRSLHQPLNIIALIYDVLVIQKDTSWTYQQLHIGHAVYIQTLDTAYLLDMTERRRLSVLLTKTA